MNYRLRLHRTASALRYCLSRTGGDIDELGHGDGSKNAQNYDHHHKFN